MTDSLRQAARRGPAGAGAATEAGPVSPAAVYYSESLVRTSTTSKPASATEPEAAGTLTEGPPESGIMTLTVIS